MPVPNTEYIAPPIPAKQSVGLEPGINAFNSLMLLCKVDFLSGLDEWVTRTLAALPADRLWTQRIVFSGLYYAVAPVRSYPSFTAYMDDLERQKPEILRQRLFEAYARFPLLATIAEDKKYMAKSLAPTDMPALLANRRTYLKYLGERFTPDHYDEDVESESHSWLNDPAAMKDQIVAHLHFMWAEHLAPEWERVKPMLQTCVDAYRQVDLRGLSNVEAAQKVVGRELDEHWQMMLDKSERVVFVPSAHVGPYLTKLDTRQALYVVFGVRQPPGVVSASPDLSRSELLVRLMALADDTRLRILHLLAQGGEICSPDIIRDLELSQSAASRHLQQLSATGYLRERRRDGAKCYSLNADHIDDTFKAFTKFLQRKDKSNV